MNKRQILHEVVCLAFSSKDMAKVAVRAIRDKTQTPSTLLDDLSKWKLVSYRDVAYAAGMATFLKGVPRHSAEMVFVGVEINGDNYNYEILGTESEGIEKALNAAYLWLGES